MYRKLGFQVIGSYEWLLPVTVMMDYRTDYEKKTQRMERVVKPFISRLIKRVEFEEIERERMITTVDKVISYAPNDEMQAAVNTKSRT